MSVADRLWFLFGAYSAFWLLLAAFLVHIGRRHRALDRELRDLERRVGRG
jgi:CcmD family protein